MFSGPALLDTHVWIWYLDGAEGQISPATVDLLRRSVRGAGLLVSDISFWEVGNKVSKGKLTLSPAPSAWLSRAERRPGFSFLPLDRQVLVSSTQLPGALHGDSVDRMLIATAALAGVPLVTADRSILDYAAAEGRLSVCDARPRPGRV